MANIKPNASNEVREQLLEQAHAKYDTYSDVYNIVRKAFESGTIEEDTYHEAYENLQVAFAELKSARYEYLRDNR